VRILRKGGQFADGRIQLLGARSLLLFVAMLLGLAVGFIFKWPRGGFLLGCVAVPLFKANVKRWGNWVVGKRGESAVTDILKSLSDDYVLLNDLTLAEGKGNVDHFLIGPSGLFVIETKNYSGNVRCDGDQWFVNGRRIKSLSRQAIGNAATVRHSLASLFSAGQKPPLITALLVFVKHKGNLILNQPALPVLKAEELLAFIQNHNGLIFISGTQAHAIVRHLQSLQPL